MAGRASEYDIILPRRLETQVSVTRGNPPLKRALHLFTELAAALRGKDEATTLEKANATLAHLASLELGYQRNFAAIEREKREQGYYQARKVEVERQMEEVKEVIERRKQELVVARTRRKQLEEYEVARKELMAMPSRAETQSKIDAVRKKIESLQTEACAVEVAMELRRAQTTLLFSVLRDLQQSIQEENLAATLSEEDLTRLLANGIAGGRASAEEGGDEGEGAEGEQEEAEGAEVAEGRGREGGGGDEEPRGGTAAKPGDREGSERIVFHQGAATSHGGKLHTMFRSPFQAEAAGGGGREGSERQEKRARASSGPGGGAGAESDAEGAPSSKRPRTQE